MTRPYRRRSSLGDSGSGLTLRQRRRPVVFMLILGMVYLYWAYTHRDRGPERARGKSGTERTARRRPRRWAPLPVTRTFSMMGTRVNVTVVPPRKTNLETLIDGVRSEMARIESVMNAHDPTSFVSRLNDLPASTPLRVRPEEAEILDVLDEARRVSELSGGAFDITVASVGRLWDFDPHRPRIPTEEEIASAIDGIDYRQVVVDRATSSVLLAGEGARIDLGGIAKGTAIDRAVDYLTSHGIRSALVDAGGDVYVLGKKTRGVPWKIALQDPRDTTGVLATLTPENIAVVTSGDYERAIAIDGKRYHHILDPRTGMPAEGLISVTVFAPKAQTADALATALFVLGPERGMELAERLEGVEAILITEDRRMHATSGLKETLRSASE
ncbi:FAD:protein FMN transferase [Candidatus Sumerlaeota bacterium]|nr:FAD:protein FMN transferase [Candidatus Sumerlaeota bacterium]